MNELLIQLLLVSNLAVWAISGILISRITMAFVHNDTKNPMLKIFGVLLASGAYFLFSSLLSDSLEEHQRTDTETRLSQSTETSDKF